MKQLGPARLGIMGAVLLSLLMFFVFVSMRVSTPDLKLLYSDLTTIDSAAMAAKLQESNIPYEVSQDGARIMVGDNDVGRARMLLAEAGLPNGGSMGYELFDKTSGFGTTNFIQNINQVRALQGELARTISALDGVRSARVHLVLPERELFSRESRQSSASVFLGVKPGASLSGAQVQAIQSLVASAVPQLKANNVSVVDQDGTLLARADGDEDSVITAKTEEMRRKYKQRMPRAVEDTAGRIVGYGGVRANVTVDLNFDRLSENAEIYDPEGQVMRSSQAVSENTTEREVPPENVSVENNLPGVGNDLFVDQKPSNESARTEETSNFEISKTTRNLVREVGEVKRLSVAVLVDGTYTTAEDGTKTYQPRTDEQLDQIAALVRSAIGFDAERGDTLEVVNMQFAQIEIAEDDASSDMIMGFEKSDLLDAAEIITVAIMVILVVLLVLQPMIGRLLATDGPHLDDDMENDLLAPRMTGPALEAPSGRFEAPPSSEDSLIDMQQVEGKVKASSVKKVEDIVDAYPTETVSVLRSWMTQE